MVFETVSVIMEATILATVLQLIGDIRKLTDGDLALLVAGLHEAQHRNT